MTENKKMDALLALAQEKRDQKRENITDSAPFAEAVVGVAKLAATEAKKDSATAVVGEDGLLHCTICGGRRQTIATFGDGKQVKVYCRCKCQAERDAAEKADYQKREEMQRVDKLRTLGFADREMVNCTFENDDGANPKLTAGMKQYCENFPRLRREGTGLLLYGPVGTGKSFYAACIVNELISRGYPCLMTTFPKLANQLSATWDGKQEIIDGLARLSLLAIDDLGVERDTEYMNENITVIVDTLCRAKIPLIITSNYTPRQMAGEFEIKRKRAFDRLLGRCHPVEVLGESRRKAMGRNNYLEMKELLGI